MYHHIKKLMYTVNVDTPIPGSETCCWSNSAARTANWPPPCSIPFKDSIATIPSARTC